MTQQFCLTFVAKRTKSVNALEDYMLMGTPKMTFVNKTGGNESDNFHITLDDTKLERVNKTKFIGVIIDGNLS